MVFKRNWPSMERVFEIDDETKATVFVDMYAEEFYDFQKAAFIWNLYVDDEYIGKGIATKLVADAEKIAKENGCAAIMLNWCKAGSQTFTKEWYEKLGYTAKETEEDFILYEKLL